MIEKPIPPEVSRDTLDIISQDKAEYSAFVKRFFRYATFSIGCKPMINDSRLADSFLAYKEDKSRMARNLPMGSTPDHFKTAGILAFWLRRFAPVYDFQVEDQRRYNAADSYWKDTVKNYASEVLAFDIGLYIFDVFHTTPRDKMTRRVPDIDTEFFHYVGYMLKFKNISSHALALVYKSLYIPHKFDT